MFSKKLNLYQKGTLQAHYFINDFILTQLIDQDINEIVQVQNPMGALCAELKSQGYKSMPVPRYKYSFFIINKLD